MALKQKVITEYITQIREGTLSGTCIHKKAENIIRGFDCKYLSVPRLETEPIMCKFHNRETAPNCFCCWAEHKPVFKSFWRNNKFLKIKGFYE